jgi:hypothetical protein
VPPCPLGDPDAVRDLNEGQGDSNPVEGILDEVHAKADGTIADIPDAFLDQ